MPESPERFKAQKSKPRKPALWITATFLFLPHFGQNSARFRGEIACVGWRSLAPYGPVWYIDPYPQPPNVSGSGRRHLTYPHMRKPDDGGLTAGQYFLRPAIRIVAPRIAAGSPPGPEACSRIAQPSFFDLPMILPGSVSFMLWPFHVPTDCTS